jgi:hypothetical protein
MKKFPPEIQRRIWKAFCAGNWQRCRMLYLEGRWAVAGQHRYYKTQI